MTYTLNLKKLLDDVRGPKGFHALMDEAEKIKKEAFATADKLRPQAKAKLKKLQSEYTKLLKKLRTQQSKVEADLNKSVARFRKQAIQAEKGLNDYKKKALKEKDRLLTKINKAPARKKAAKKARKKTTRRA